MPARSILFVCAANRCRSPLAAALLQRLLDEQPEGIHWRVESAGLHAIPDLPATQWVQAAAQEIGLDLSRHRSRAIDQLQLANYDLVLPMEQVQAEALASAYPLLANKIRLFSSLLNLRVDIDDPTGHGLREHRALVALLSRYLQAALPQLRRLLAQPDP